MSRQLLSTCIVLAISATVVADPLNWGWVDVQSLPPRGPIGSGTAGPQNIGEGATPSNPQPGECFYYMIDDGENMDNNGSSSSHFDPEGGAAGSYRGQAWVRWDGLIDNLKTDCDDAFGTGEWTVSRIWYVLDEASFTWANGPGVLTTAEVPALGSAAPVADWGDPSSATQTQVELGVPVGYHGHYMTATSGGTTNQSFLIYDGTAGAAVPTGSNSFAQIACSTGDDMVIPSANSFSLYLAPLNDFSGGQGWNMALSFDGFASGSYGFSPLMVFEVCKRDGGCTTNNIPVAHDSLCNHVPFSATAGETCAFTLFASDADVADTLTFDVASTGSLGGVCTPSVAGPQTDGAGNWWLDVTYTIPAGVRGLDTLTFSVDDGTNPSGSATINVQIRGDAMQNTIAFGNNTGDGSTSMKLITGSLGAGGGLDDGGPAIADSLGCTPFMQSVEFDNYGCSHDPNGNLFGLDYGDPDTLVGNLYVYATQASCDDPGATVVFTFDDSHGPDASRVTSLSISPDNSKIAVWGADTYDMWILDYTPGSASDVGMGGAAAATVTFNKVIHEELFGTQSVGVEWLDNNTLLMTDYSCMVRVIDVATGSTNYWNAPTGFPCYGAQVAEITYNAEIAPYIYVMFGAYSGGATYNGLYVLDTTGNPVAMSGGDFYKEYNPGDSGATWREAGMDCYGNLFIATYGSEIYYLPAASDPTTIVGGFESMVLWRDSDPFSSYTGMDVAHCGVCSTTPPMADGVECVCEGTCLSDTGAVCSGTITLRATDSDSAVTMFIVDNPGEFGGTLTLVGSPVEWPTGSGTWTQDATYTSASSFCGVECFTYRATDGDSESDDAVACAVCRTPTTAGTIAFGGSFSDSAQTMRLYHGCHSANGGTYAYEEALDYLTYAQSVEFDNYMGVSHNPQGNLLSLNFGTTAGGGMLYVYPTQACGCDTGSTTLYAWDGVTGGNLSRVSGLSVCPDNTKIAVYGYDTQTIFVLEYETDSGAGCGNDAVGEVSSLCNMTGLPVTGNDSLATGWLDNETILWVDQSGNLYTIPVCGTPTLRTPCPRTIDADAIQMTDIEYNPAISPNIVVVIAEYDGGVTTNTLYFVDPATWAVVPQASGATFTDHSGNGTGGFREIAWDSCGNLLFGTYVGDDRVNLRLIPQAADASTVENDGSVVWNVQDEEQWTSGYSGMDVALGGSDWCCGAAGDTNIDGFVNGQDIQGFVTCWLAFGDESAPGSGCCSADVDGSGTVDLADVDAFVTALLD